MSWAACWVVSCVVGTVKSFGKPHNIGSSHASGGSCTLCYSCLDFHYPAYLLGTFCGWLIGSHSGLSLRGGMAALAALRPHFNLEFVDRDFRFTAYDSVPKFCIAGWGGFPRTRVSKMGTPWKDVNLSLLACPAWKRLQICGDVLLIVTSTGDELFRGINIEDLEQFLTLKIEDSSNFLVIFGCEA